MADDANASIRDADVGENSQQGEDGLKAGSQSRGSEGSSESQLSSVAESAVSDGQAEKSTTETHVGVKPRQAIMETAIDQIAGKNPAEPANETVPDAPFAPEQAIHETRSAAPSPPPKPVDADSTPSLKVKKPKSQMVGGLLASNKTMKPFRSPIVGRQPSSSTCTSATSVDTPTRSSSLSTSSTSKALSKPLTTPFRAAASASSANKALNKPFVSPIVKASASSSSSTVSSSNGESGEVPMSSFQLNSALPVLERKLANLRNAKRYLKAVEKDLQTSDNTTHILELSVKWLNAGREASEMLWELTKDSYNGSEQGGEANDSGYGNGRFGGGDRNSSWGWAVTDEVKEMTEASRKELEDMSDKDREEAIRHIEDEDARDPLPDSPQEILSRSSSRSSSSTGLKRKSSSTSKTSSNESQGRPKKLARLDEENLGEIEEDARTEEEVEQESFEVDPEILDNPNNRGMAKMLLQCGIDLKTFGWDAVKEEWDPNTVQDV